jgi:hypothetical protein
MCLKVINHQRFVTHLEYEEKCVLYQYCLTILYEIFIVRFVINYLYCIYVFRLKQNVRITFKTSLTFFRQLRFRPFLSRPHPRNNTFVFVQCLISIMTS